ncbi:MAG: sigma 54-interacting transcriptional regulator [Ketobacteraceae bacterium]|nr:sigma 54-interacting transcriptional regulator [Ketobacteraceae bacterium]
MYQWQQIGFWSAPSALLIIDPHLDRLLAANSAACKFLRSDLPTLLKQRVSDLFAGDFSQLIVFSQEVMQNGQADSDQLHLRKPGSDEVVRVEVNGCSHVVDGDTLMTLAFADAELIEGQRDRRDAQRHYRSGLGHWQRMSQVFSEFEKENRLLLDAAGEGIYGVDANGLTTFMNPAAERILGWKAEELIGKNMHSLIHAHRADGSHYHVQDCPIYKAFREGTVRSVDDDVFWTKPGKPIDVEYTSTPIKDNGHVVGAVIVFRDITEKKHSQKRLLEALEEVETLKHRLEMENAYLQEELNSEFNHQQIIGKSKAIQHIIQRISLVAPSDVTVLISGESGTGKELIARAIHEASDRGKRSLIRVNCAAIPSELFESEFFGHIKGAFTGATVDRPGRFELADGGTLFLDEVGEIPLTLQGKLLRVLQEQQFERVGDSKTRHVDVRIIAATNRDLREMVDAGEFREDLYFRLNVFPVESVPLRDRLDDIPLLAQYFLKRSCTRANKAGLKISLRQLEILKQYDWPGNIRELENVIERQVILAQGDALRFDELAAEMTQRESKTAAAEVRPATPIASDADLKRQQRETIVWALKKSGGKVFGEDGAAAALGVKPTTLSSRIKRFKIDRSEFMAS